MSRTHWDSCGCSPTHEHERLSRSREGFLRSAVGWWSIPLQADPGTLRFPFSATIYSH